jgi:hypothetical protein
LKRTLDTISVWGKWPCLGRPRYTYLDDVAPGFAPGRLFEVLLAATDVHTEEFCGGEKIVANKQKIKTGKIIRKHRSRDCSPLMALVTAHYRRLEVPVFATHATEKGDLSGTGRLPVPGGPSVDWRRRGWSKARRTHMVQQGDGATATGNRSPDALR